MLCLVCFLLSSPSRAQYFEMFNILIGRFVEKITRDTIDLRSKIFHTKVLMAAQVIRCEKPNGLEYMKLKA